MLDPRRLVIFLLATYGDGEPTDNAAELYNWTIKASGEDQELLKASSVQLSGFSSHIVQSLLSVIARCRCASSSSRKTSAWLLHDLLLLRQDSLSVCLLQQHQVARLVGCSVLVRTNKLLQLCCFAACACLLSHLSSVHNAKMSCSAISSSARGFEASCMWNGVLT